MSLFGICVYPVSYIYFSYYFYSVYFFPFSGFWYKKLLKDDVQYEFVVVVLLWLYRRRWPSACRAGSISTSLNQCVRPCCSEETPPRSPLGPDTRHASKAKYSWNPCPYACRRSVRWLLSTPLVDSVWCKRIISDRLLPKCVKYVDLLSTEANPLQSYNLSLSLCYLSDAAENRTSG